MGKITSSSTSDVLLDWQAMADMFEEQACWLVALNDWQIALILSLLRYAHWVTRWINFNNWDDVDASVAETERCLMSGCDLSGLTEKLDEIITVIGNIDVTCAPVINIPQGPIIVNCATQGTGEEPPSEPGIEGEDPPGGWIAANPEIDNRKCKVANFIYDEMYTLIDQFVTFNVAGLGELAMGIVMGSVVAIVALVVTGPLAVAVAVVGVVSVWALRLLAEDIDLEGLLSDMDTAHQALVCALYSSLDANQARASFHGVLQALGASTSQLLFIDAILINDVVNSLFFQRDDSYGQSLEAQLETYETEIACVECGEEACLIEELNLNFSGTVLSDETSEGVRVIQIQAGYIGFYKAGFEKAAPPPYCAFSVETATVIAGVFNCLYPGSNCGFWQDCASSVTNKTDIDAGLEETAVSHYWYSSTPFTLEVTLISQLC